MIIYRFNAVVRNILLQNNDNTNNSDEPEKKQPTPCDEVKSEQIKEQPKEDMKKEEAPKNEATSESESLEDSVTGIETTPATTTKAEEATTVAPEASKENVEGVTPESLGNNNVIPYNDIIKCLQAKLRATQIETQRQANLSPLTYILLPSLASKPC